MIQFALDEDIDLLQKVYGDTTSKGSEVLIGYCSICKKQISMTVSDNILVAEGFGDFKYLAKRRIFQSKKMAKKLLLNQGRALDFTGNIATAATSRNPNVALSTLSELITFSSHWKRIVSHAICLIL